MKQCVSLPNHPVIKSNTRKFCTCALTFRRSNSRHIKNSRKFKRYNSSIFCRFSINNVYFLGKFCRVVWGSIWVNIAWKICGINKFCLCSYSFYSCNNVKSFPVVIALTVRSIAESVPRAFEKVPAVGRGNWPFPY